MSSIKDIIEPVKAYQIAKDAFHQNAVDYFDDLIKTSGANLSSNKASCEAYYQKLKDIESSNQQAKKKKNLKTFLRVLEVLCYITVALIPVGILLHKKIKKIDNNISDINKATDKLTNESNNIKSEANKEANKLNNLYDWNIAPKLFSKTLPLIQTDARFEVNRLQYLIDKFGYQEHKEKDISTLFVQSGTINGNPFVIEQNFVEEIRPFVYTGTLVIHYVTYVSDGNGHTRAVHHNQTLVAHVSKPKPFYFAETWLVYGNAAAPNLTFSRSPSNLKQMDDKALNKFANRYDKKLSKIAKKDLNFTKMANTKFESLFGAIDRDNEVEFRLLFTPLAQSNMIDLIRMKEPYGDDFIFAKRHELNYIKTNHSQDFDYSSNPTMFINFDIEKSRQTFVEYCDKYFQTLYFDLAPLLTIPLYQNYKAQEYIYKDNQKSRHTSFEVESLANQFDSQCFMPKNSATKAILKSSFVKRDGNIDEMNITAYAFKAIPHVELVPVLGGDGRMHNVPVPWDEYVEISKTTPLYVKLGSTTRSEQLNAKNVFTAETKNVYYQKGLVSAILNLKNN